MTRLSALGIFSAVLVSSTAAALGACSSSSPDASEPAVSDAGNVAVDAGAVPDADNGAPSTQYPAPHPALPKLSSLGGTILTAPRVIPIFFPGDEYQAQIETFLHQMATSGNWAATTAEYGVGPLTIAPSVVLATAPAATVSDTEVGVLAQQVALGTAPLDADAGSTDAGAPTPTQNDIYIVFYPTSTTISEAANYNSCESFGAYHADTKVTTAAGDTQIVYVPMPRCPDFYASEGLVGVDEVTSGVSHEIVEAVTDPYSETKGAYVGADDDHKVWAVVLAASETADMCSWEVPSTNKPTGIDFETSRIWSNTAAAAGHDPCVPAPADPYFASIPDLTEDVTIPEFFSYGADGKIIQGGKTKGIQLAVGESKTIDLVLYSDGPTSGPWTVTPEETTTTPSLSFSLDRNSGVNGERLHLTVTRTAKAAAHRGSPFIIYSSIGPASSSSRMSLAMVYVAD